MDILETKRLLLDRVYEALEREIARKLNAACQKGCAWCCTQDVTITTAEALPILDFLRAGGREDLMRRLDRADPARFRPSYTLNDFAQACFERRDLPEEGPRNEPAACLLLEDDQCAVYPVRPLACRAFVSTTACGPGHPAEAPPGLTALAAVCQQIAEHLDAGGLYGNLTDVLRVLGEDTGARAYRLGKPLLNARGLLPARALPGFLIHPEAAETVRPFLDRLFGGDVGGAPFHHFLAELGKRLP